MRGLTILFVAFAALLVMRGQQQPRCDALRARQERRMSTKTPESVILRAIHEAFIKYPEGDGGPNLDYQWVQPEQSAHVAKAILLELAANGFKIVNDGA
jgi:hypothetical protein